jgi:ubiquitin-like 1-activating enzyme E1 B
VALEDSTNDEKKQKVSTRQWAQSHEYNPQKLFQKLFTDDIKYLLSMENLWQKRRAPTPLDWTELPDQVPSKSTDDPQRTVLKDQRVWSMKECGEVFSESVLKLKERLAVSCI